MHIVGIGSPFGFDQLGWLVIERIRGDGARRLFGLGDAELSALDRPGAGLLAAIGDSHAAILVDAIEDDALRRGTVVCLDGHRLQHGSGHASSHGLGLAEALALGRALDGLPARLAVVGMAAGGEGSRAPSVAEVEQVCAAVVETARCWQMSGGAPNG
ncbi:MAG: hydrogenase maturation protease [Gammaproteobacteria bacterium]